MYARFIKDKSKDINLMKFYLVFPHNQLKLLSTIRTLLQRIQQIKLKKKIETKLTLSLMLACDQGLIT